MNTDPLQTFAIMGLAIILSVVIYQLNKTRGRAARLKATVLRHNRFFKRLENLGILDLDDEN